MNAPGTDQVVGIAVLDRKTGVLAMWCQRADGRKIYQEIPVHPRGFAALQSPSWQYVEAGGILDVTPSVHIRVDRLQGAGWETEFHNADSWSVRFINRPATDEADGVRLYERLSFCNKEEGA